MKDRRNVDVDHMQYPFVLLYLFLFDIINDKKVRWTLLNSSVKDMVCFSVKLMVSV